MEFQNVFRDSHLPRNVTIPFVCLQAVIANIPRPPKYRILPPIILSETITQFLDLTLCDHQPLINIL